MFRLTPEQGDQRLHSSVVPDMLVACSLSAHSRYVTSYHSGANCMLALRGSSRSSPIPAQASWRLINGSAVLRPATTANIREGQRHADLVNCVGHKLSEVLPADIDLDLNFDSHQNITSLLNSLEARGAGKSLIQLWSLCEPLTESFLKRYRVILSESGEQPANELAVHIHMFCNKLVNMTTSEADTNRNMDTYTVCHMCLQVCSPVVLNDKPYWCFTASMFVLQLLWHMNADNNLKAWVCGTVLCKMAAAAGRVQVCLLVRPPKLVVRAQHAVLISSFGGGC